jgi:hypothetical protein
MLSYFYFGFSPAFATRYLGYDNYSSRLTRALLFVNVLIALQNIVGPFIRGDRQAEHRKQKNVSIPQTMRLDCGMPSKWKLFTKISRETSNCFLRLKKQTETDYLF